jgi:hypothetical protein
MRRALAIVLWATVVAAPASGDAGTATATAFPASARSTLPDFNGDGFADLAIGVGSETVGTAARAGATEVMYGSAAGVQAESPDDQFITQNTPGVKDVAEEGDTFGTGEAGDFNGDGFADLAIVALNEDVGSVRDAGAINVLYGSAGGLQATNPDDQRFTQNSPGVKGIARASDHFGISIAADDFNGDGFADLAVGAFGDEVGSVRDAGAVNVLYGSTGGLQAASPDDQLFTQDRPGVKDVAEERDSFGVALAAADFDLDGFADLAIGASGEDAGPVLEAGGVNVLYGSAVRLQVVSPDDQFFTQNSPEVAEAAEQGDAFGISLAAGDFNGDGFPDLGIGAVGETVGGESGAGGVNVLYGSAAGLQAVSPDDQFFTQDSPGVEDVAESSDFYGFSLESGDFNGDGLADLAVAIDPEDVGSIFNAGAVNVLYGSEAGLQAVSPDDQFFTQDSPGVEDVSEAYDGFGGSLAAGDFNLDGTFDLALGEPLEDVDTLLDAGAVNVLYGSAAGLQVVSPEDQFFTQDSPGVKDIAEEQDHFGAFR